MNKFLTVVIQMPEDIASRKAISEALQLGGEFHGGRITGMSLEDEMTMNEQLVELGGEEMFSEAEKRTAAVHAACG